MFELSSKMNDERSEEIGDNHVGTSAKTPLRADAFDISDEEKIEKAMFRSVEFAKNQYEKVSNYIKSIDSTKTIHIGETGWSSQSDGFFGADGSRAADQLKQAMYYETLMGWCREQNMSCFFFEAFDEQWKSSANPSDPENHFGLFELDGSAKYVLWPLVDQGIFEGLSREGQRIKKTFDGQVDRLIESALIPQNEKLIKH